LNQRGDRPAQGEAGTRLGWDLAGVVEQPAAEGPGPARGARVVGLVRSGSWAEQAAVPASALAELAPSVTYAQAAALPTVGLTALAAVGYRGSLLARTVLVTGASGGLGLIASAAQAPHRRLARWRCPCRLSICRTRSSTGSSLLAL
jgi:NADPH:quinone reductase